MYICAGLVLLSSLPFGNAGPFDNGISLASDKVTAETRFTATIADGQYYDPSYSGRDIAKIEVYLAASAASNAASMGGNSFDSQCTLLSNISLCDNGISVFNNHIDLSNSTFTVSIPKDIGPPGKFYSLHAQMYLTNGKKYSGEISSPPFTLSGATGHFGAVQQKGYALWTATYFPCSSFSCVVACADGASATAGATSDSTQYHECAAKCPGVTLPPSDSPDLNNGTPPLLPTNAPACLLSATPSSSSLGSRSPTSSPSGSSSTTSALSNAGQGTKRGISATAAVLLFFIAMST
ncbi:hypothetical protein CPB83DRAFT_851433 [Crepidotus variabilis]|uniref:Uncharacterized protein n=1 Tax=Crepidotus variabilis TaxID=179855 RepID=A0A9P6JR80_9AGAR|nr:hypothetical protein CPB83DRAFT_851433 [Crepidotus variabilis]